MFNEEAQTCFVSSSCARGRFYITVAAFPSQTHLSQARIVGALCCVVLSVNPFRVAKVLAPGCGLINPR